MIKNWEFNPVINIYTDIDKGPSSQSFVCPGRVDQGGEPQMFRLGQVSFPLASD